MIKTVVKVILIIAVVGFGASYFLAERAEKAAAEFHGTATYSGTYFTTDTRVWPDLSGTCTLTIDFDAGTVSISLAGDLSGTVTGRYSKYLSYEDFGFEPGASRRIKVRYAGRIYECLLFVHGVVPNKDRNHASGRWLLRSLDPSVPWIRGTGLGAWQAQKVSTP